jgi:DNA polymerase-3 subunit epsilon
MHGLTDAFLADKPTIRRGGRRHASRSCEGADVVIHNAGLRRGLSQCRVEARLGREPCSTPWWGKVTDTLADGARDVPGQGQFSLDALCKRLEVDNSNRSLHGALLDAGLLAEVYIRLTRGQDSHW